jgi:hypothetical protein
VLEALPTPERRAAIAAANLDADAVRAIGTLQKTTPKRNPDRGTTKRFGLIA